MVRTAWAVLAGLLLAATPAPAAEAPAGSWKLTFFTQGEARTLWIVKLENKDGKWTGQVVATTDGVPETTIDNLKVADGRVDFVVKVGRQDLGFEGKLTAPTAERIKGSLAFGRSLIPAELEATSLTGLGETELNKELLAKKPDSPEVFNAAISLLQEAAEQKATPAEVRGWADTAFKAAEAYGPRWQRDVGSRITSALVSEEAFAPVALEYARRVERLLGPADSPEDQVRVLNLLAQALKKTGRADEIKDIQTRIDKLEARIDQEFAKKVPPLKVEPFAGRKEKSDRVVLVELFTGAQCPPCVAADLAFDGLEKTFKPTDVVLLQYHLHIPGPDPLTSPASIARSEYYGDSIEGTPTIFFEGKAAGFGGGGIDAAELLYGRYRKVVDPLLETPALAKLKANVARSGDKLDITAEISDLALPGDKVRLRFALVEEVVRYSGSNGLRFHHHVVRAMPGGAEGFALKEKSGKQAVQVNLGEVRKELTTYLDGFVKENGPFSGTVPPLNFKHLYVVAFVQNDTTKEVYQATQVTVAEE